MDCYQPDDIDYRDSLCCDDIIGRVYLDDYAMVVLGIDYWRRSPCGHEQRISVATCSRSGSFVVTRTEEGFL